MPELFVQHHSFKKETLDQMLEVGWYRMAHLMFTTDVIIHPQKGEFAVHWLRYEVAKVPHRFFTGRNFKKLNAKYTVDFVPLEEMDTRELEDLYTLYRAHTKFEQAETLGIILGNYSPFFDTLVVTVRHSGTLIAAGILDLGSNSLAGIKNIYHPAYAAESLGIYLLMQEMKHCQSESYRWFYPGYIAPGYPNFDYKIYPTFSEVFIAAAQEWVPYEVWLNTTGSH